MKIVKLPQLNEKSSNFNEIWQTDAYLEIGDSDKYELV